VNGTAAAVKIYYPGQLEKRIQREISALKAVACDSLVRVLWHGSVQADGKQLAVVATEFVEGMPLNRMLENRRLTHEQLGVVGFDVALAIEAIWSRRIVHRDLKPSNILIRPNGRACVIDLGLARHLDETSITESGVTWGTRGYMSPEQCRCIKALSCHSDMFSLGVPRMRPTTQALSELGDPYHGRDRHFVCRRLSRAHRARHP
jgi:serine/threonine-protein kinase